MKIRAAASSGRRSTRHRLEAPVVIDVEMQNEPVPTAGHWNIADIYSPGARSATPRPASSRPTDIALQGRAMNQLLARAPDGDGAAAAGDDLYRRAGRL